MAYSLLDVIQGNPFDAAQNAAVGQSGNFPAAPMPASTPQQQVAQQQQVFPPAPTPDQSNPVLSQANAAVAKYNPMFDPEGPLARSGPIGALLFGNGESRQDYILARQQQYQQMVQQQLGGLRYNAFTQLQDNIQQGMTPQKAFLSFLSTPAGADFIHKDPNPGEAIQQFMKLGTVDPMVQARMNVFGNGQQASPPPMGAGPQVSPQAAQQAPNGIPAQGQPAATVGTPSSNPSSQISPQQMAKAPMLDPIYFLGKANDLMNYGDIEGAKEAVNMANLAQQTRAYLHPALDTPQIKNYIAYSEQAINNGEQPMSLDEYTLRHERAGAIASETAFNQELGKSKAGVVKTYLDAGTHARDVFNTLGLMQDALNQGNGHIDTGPGAELLMQGKQAMANLFGINVEGLPQSEVFSKLGKYMASAASKELTSRPTQFDFKTFIQNNPGLDVSVQGNKMLIDMMAQQAKHEMEISNLAMQYKGDGSDWGDVVANYDKTHPFISPFTGKPIKPTDVIPGIGNETAGQRPQSSGEGQPSQAISTAPQEGAIYLNKTTGERRIFQNGEFKPYGK